MKVSELVPRGKAPPHPETPLDHLLPVLAEMVWRKIGNFGSAPAERIPTVDQLTRFMLEQYQIHRRLDPRLRAEHLEGARMALEWLNADWWKRHRRMFESGEPYAEHPLLDGSHPLFGVILEYIGYPNIVEPAPPLRGDPILSAKMGMVSDGNERSVQLVRHFSHAAHAEPAAAQLAFPFMAQTFPDFATVETDIKGPALPLALYHLGNPNPQAPGAPAAPLALRLFVEAILATPYHTRPSGEPVAVELTLRELLERLYPGRKPKRNEYQPRLMDAMRTLDDTYIPWRDPKTGEGGQRRLVIVRDIPPALDDTVTLEVHLPPGSGPGPIVSPRLREWGVKSATAYYALLNLAYTWFEPGRTRSPVLNQTTKKLYWAQVLKDHKRYPVLDDKRLMAITHPMTKNNQRRNVLVRSMATLERLHEAGEIQIVRKPSGLRILPPKDYGQVPDEDDEDAAD